MLKCWNIFEMEEKGVIVVGFGRKVEPIGINGRLGVKLKLLIVVSWPFHLFFTVF